MSKAGAINAVAVIDALFPQRLSEDAIEVYVEMLSDLPDVLLLATVKELVATAKFRPTVAEIRAAAIPEGHGSAGAAWEEVTTACRTVGRGVAPEWSDPLIRDALNMAGGYIEACNTEQPGYMQGRFTASYKALVEQARHDELIARHPDPTMKEIET